MFPIENPEPDPIDQAEAALNPEPGLLPPSMPEAIDYRVPGMDRQKRQKLGLHLLDAYTSFKSSQERRLQNIRDWREDVEMLPWHMEGPWPGSAAVRAPLTATAVRKHAQQLNTMICQAVPPFRAKAEGPEAAPYLRALEDVVTNKLQAAGWEDIAREVHEALPLEGNGLVGTFYKQKPYYRPVPQLEQDENLLGELVDAQLDFDEAMAASVKTDAKGQTDLSIGFEEVIEEGVEFRFVPMERLVVLPTNATRPEDIWGMGERLTVRGADLLAGVKEKRYIKEAVRELLRTGSDSLTTEEDDDYEDAAGVDEEAQDLFDGDDDFKTFEIIELYLLMDLNRDGKQEWYCVAFHEATGLVLRCQYSPYDDGKCPWVLFRYICRPGRLWWQSIAERNAVMQSSATTAINAAHNLTDILAGSGSSYFYTARAGIKPQTKVWTPGVPIPVDNISEVQPIVFPQLGQAIQANLQILEVAKAASELLCSTSNPTLGRETEGDKTAREVTLVANSAHQGFLDYAAIVALCWAQVMERFVSRLAQYAKNQVVDYQVQAGAGEGGVGPDGQPAPGREVFTMDPTGQPTPQPVAPGEVGFGQIPADLLRLPFKLVPAGMYGYADAETRLRAALMVLQTIVQHPIAAQMPELQIEALDQFFTDVRTPNAEQLTQKLYEGWQQLQAAMQAQALLQQQAMAQQEQAMGAEQQGAEQDRAFQQQQADRAAQTEDQRFAMEQDRHVMEMAGMQKPPPPGANGGKKK